MEFSISPTKIQNEAGRWFVVISQFDEGYLARDAVTSDLVYMKHTDVACKDGCEEQQ
ncbi:MAG: hypothetical protein PHO26_01165 [Dehalococcoidia bacterium]|nr:hypothetical protein [Dehalococcoidia bacterium]MDD5493525.1 hypothetical protein [Dehalococcoidia bacterium]